MTDFQTLYLVFIVCCLAECAVLVEGCPVLITRLFCRWGIFHCPGIAVTRGNRLVFLNPVPWFAEWHLAPQLQCTAVRGGILSVNSLSDLPYPGICRIKAEGGPLHSLFRQQLEESGFSLEGCPPGTSGTAESGREESRSDARDACATIADYAYRRWTDPSELIIKRSSIRSPLIQLQVLCTLQLGVGLASGPLFLLELSTARVILGCLIGMYLLGIVIVPIFCVAWKRLLPEKNLPWVRAAWMILYPPASMRAIQILSPAMHGKRHESAVVYALIGQSGQGKAYLEQLLAFLRHRLFSRSLVREDCDALAEANESLARAIRFHWRVPVRVLKIPPWVEADAVCYCPVCRISLARSLDYCPHCLEVRTLPCGGKEEKPLAADI